MMSKKKRKRVERSIIHPRNKYSDSPPDFGLLASLYPSFEPYVFYSRDGRPRIDWTDFSATRELTRVLLLHDHAINWWIPDGQLCPTVPNRSNYINWIEDLLLSDIMPNTRANGEAVKGFDIGTGANCIYPLLGWSFVGTPAEMVCTGGEQAFISRIIEDSVKLKQSFRWYTSMVGKESNMKILTSKLRDVGVSVAKTTEFVQDQTCRWGLHGSLCLLSGR